MKTSSGKKRKSSAKPSNPKNRKLSDLAIKKKLVSSVRGGAAGTFPTRTSQQKLP